MAFDLAALHVGDIVVTRDGIRRTMIGPGHEHEWVTWVRRGKLRPYYVHIPTQGIFFMGQITKTLKRSVTYRRTDDLLANGWHPDYPEHVRTPDGL